MGEASETMMVSQRQQSVTPKKKRGRPSLSDLHNRALLLQNQSSSSSNPQIPNPHFPQNPNHLPRKARSSRRSTPTLTPDFVDGSDYDDDDDDDDDDRVQKKVKLVGRLPPNSTSFASDVVNAVSEDEKGSKGTDTHTQNGTRMLDAGPTTAAATTRLPGNKKLLLLILDKLQKKDTRGVFAEPVDPEELPDYHEVIEHPMDFGTVRKKLDSGLYTTLEHLEADIYLICSNAMEYNAPSTIYFRQARSIQELAKKEFEALRQDGGNNEPPPKPRRGRPPGSRNMKKLLESPLDRGAGESSSDATPVSRDDDTVRSNSYNLRKGPSLYRFPRNLESSFDFPASASKSMPMKYGGDKQYDSEESKREPYNQFEECVFGQDPSLSSIFRAFDKKLISVGLDFEHSYARSLAKFARDLGPVVWRIVSKKLRSVLPPGVEFGPGWVGENKTSTTQLSHLPESSVQSHSLSQDSFRNESQHHPSTSSFVNSALGNKSSSHCNERLVEVSRDLNSKSDWSQLKGTNGIVGAGPSFQQIQQGPIVHPGMNGLNRPFGLGFRFQEGIAMPKALPFNPSQSQASKSHPSESSAFEACRSLGSSGMTLSPIDFDCALRAENDNLGMHGVPYWQNVSIQERWDLPYQAEQNTGFQASDSRSSSLPVGSPPPLDLVLQL